MRLPFRKPEPPPPPKRRPLTPLIAPVAALAVGVVAYLGARRRRKA